MSLYKVATAKLNVRVHFSLQILCPCDNVSSDPNSSLAVISFTSCNFYKCPLNVCKQQPCSNGTEKQQRKHRFVFRQNYCFWTTFPQFLSHLDIQNLIKSTRVLGRFTHCTEEGWRCQDISLSSQKFRGSIDLLSYTTGYCSHHWFSSRLPCFFDVDVRIPDGNFVFSFLFFRIADEGSKVSPSPLKYPGLSHQCNKVRLWKLFFCRFLHRLSGPSNPKPYP